VHINALEAYESINKIRGMADILIPLHDLSIGRRKSIPAPAAD
jgi:N-acyl homoserine lactone hydrolase